jgi:hypothetical protein
MTPNVGGMAVGIITIVAGVLAIPGINLVHVRS